MWGLSVYRPNSHKFWRDTTLSYILGLDIGITSVGYAVLATDKNGNPYKILCLNSVIFPRAENPKNGSSLARPTRQHRGSRRTNRRAKFRKKRVRSLFIRYHLLDKYTISDFLSFKTPHHDIWYLRELALKERISNEELFEILYYFAGHRGFKSNRRSEVQSDNQDSDKRIVLSNIAKNDKRVKDFKTFGEFMGSLPEFNQIKHNKTYREESIIFPLRRWLVDEIREILHSQHCLGNTDLTRAFTDEYLSIFQSQRDFDQGPAKPSRFGGNLIKRMVGVDSLDPKEKRAAKTTETFFRFNFLSQLNNLKIRYMIGQPFILLTNEQRKIILDATRLKSLSFGQIRKKLNLNDEARFNLVDYDNSKKDFTKDEEKKFFKQDTLVDIRKVTTNYQLIDDIGTILSYYKGDSSRWEHLRTLGLSEDQIEQLLPIKSSGFSNLSLKTMRNILPYLEKGQLYNEAAQSAGYDFKNNKVNRAYLRDNITNPVVNRAVAKTLKVVNAVIKKYGKPDAIHIELTREIKHNFAERNEIKKNNDKNQRKNEALAEQLRENGIPVNGINILKQKLFNEQGGIDLYTGKPINEEHLFTDTLFQIDHIIPYSLCFDDSFTNKTVTATHCNQAKANRTPLQYLGQETTNAERFKNCVMANIKNARKRQNLLTSSFDEKDRKAWKSRNINDTGYINRLLSQYLRQNITFTTRSKSPVLTVNGATTAHIRNRYGIIKNREATDLHHAVDAVVLACITPKFIKDVTRYSEFRETRYSKKLRQNKSNYQGTPESFPQPWPDFRNELVALISSDPTQMMLGHQWEHYTDDQIKQLKPAFVIRTANHKISGPAHEETTYSPQIFNETSYGLLRTPINKLKYDSKHDIIQNYPLAKDGSNQNIYAVLKQKLIEKDGDAKEAFPTGQVTVNMGKNLQIVTHVKTIQKLTSPTTVNQGRGIAKNGRMLRVDIFKLAKTNKLIGIPIYVADAVKHTLPNLAVKGTTHQKWIQIQSEDLFVTSLAQNDLIKVTFTKPVKLTNHVTGEVLEQKELLCYFTGFNIANTQLEFHSINGDYKINKVVLGKILKITRYQLDYLGNYYPIRHEHRLPFK